MLVAYSCLNLLWSSVHNVVLQVRIWVCSQSTLLEQTLAAEQHEVATLLGFGLHVCVQV